MKILVDGAGVMGIWQGHGFVLHGLFRARLWNLSRISFLHRLCAPLVYGIPHSVLQSFPLVMLSVLILPLDRRALPKDTETKP